MTHAPREIRTPTVQTDHKALNLAHGLPDPSECRRYAHLVRAAGRSGLGGCIASERWSRTDRIAPDGTVAVYGLAIRLFRQGEGTIIRDAGWIRFLEDGLVFRGPRRRSDLRRRLRF